MARQWLKWTWFRKSVKAQDTRCLEMVGNGMTPLKLAIKLMSKSEALQKIAESKCGTDERVGPAIENACIVLGGTILDKTSFLSLIWHEIDECRILTPRSKSRTLKDVAERMIEEERTFNTLCSLKESNGWFKRCLEINECFDHDILDFFVVANECDKIYERTPCGSLYIYDGCHRSLVYAYKLLTGELRVSGRSL